MTKQEFIEFTSNQLKSGFNSTRGYNRGQLAGKLHQIYGKPFNSEIILDFFCDIGLFGFVRAEKASNDILYFDIRFIDVGGLKMTSYYEYAHDGVCFWNDIECVVAAAVQVRNCSGIIEYIFMSENGKFYNEKHQLIADNEEHLFDYLANVEYNFHPVISNRTYDFLVLAGWHNNRHLDTTSVYKAFKQRNIELSQLQLNVIAEFSGLYFGFNDTRREVNIFSVETLINYDPEFQNEIMQYDNVIAKNVIRFGKRMAGDIYLDANGILLDEWYYPLGRTTLECINHLMADVPENCVFQFTGEHF